VVYARPDDDRVAFQHHPHHGQIMPDEASPIGT
jgi:hypothetical protein